MIRKMKSRLFGWVLAFVLCFSFSGSKVEAASLARTSANTSVSGWAYSTQSGHMGVKTSNYTFDSSTTYNTYSTYLSNGIALWGTNISMGYTSQSTAKGLIIASDAASDATASTLVVSVDSNGHRTKFTITIYSVNFLGSYTNVNGRNRTIAHEIGHAYGLGDISQSSNIMYGSYSTLKQVTTQDIWGMKVVTHQHNHSSSTTGTYSQLNASYHNVVCSSCYGIYKQDHSYVNGICSKCGRAQ